MKATVIALLVVLQMTSVACSSLTFDIAPIISLSLNGATVLGLLFVFMTDRRRTVEAVESVLERLVEERTQYLSERMRHYERAAMTDALTGLLNRRGGEESIGHHVARSRRVRTAFSFLLLDIDNFKAINDKHGHAIGDLVLSSIANIVRDTLRASDFGIRWGGEEFLVCLPDTDLEGATMAAEKLRAAVEKMDLGVTQVTASFGCAELGDDPFSLALARADMHLYFAKSKGKNRVFPKLEKLA